MLVAEKYRLHREIGWSDEAEVHSGPPDATHGVPLAVKMRHGMGGPPRPDGFRERFLRAVNDQQVAVLAGCKQVAPIFEMGHEGDNAYYVSPHYPRSVDSLIQGRVTLDVTALHHIASSVLDALEQLRDLHGRPHGNLKPTNIFLEGKSVRGSKAILSDLALREVITGGEGADCYSLGAAIFQLVRARSIRHFDWPLVHGEDWEKLGPLANGWREFCNLLMSPETSARPDALKAARAAFKNMRRLGAAASKRAGAGGDAASTSRSDDRSAVPGRKGLFAGIGAVLLLVGGSGAALLQPADSKIGRQLRSIGALAPLVRLIDGHPHQQQNRLPTDRPLDALAGGGADSTPALGTASPTPLAVATPAPTPESTPMPTPAQTVAVAQATPLPENPADKWIGYDALLQQLRRNLRDPALLDQPEVLTGYVTRLKESVGFLPVKDELTVVSFLKKMPAKIEATGDQPDLPGSLWNKESASRQEDVQTTTYQWGKSGFRMSFNRVPSPGGNGPAFYLSATTVPVRFGVVLAKMAEADGKGPLSGAASVKGPVAWEYANGNYGLRISWMVLDSVNANYYANAGRPSADSPMNGLSGIEAARLARAAGCNLPTLTQWNAVLAGPAGQKWTADWQTAAKVRGPQWSVMAKGIQAQRVTGAKLPNDQCFGDRTDLSPVGQSPDQSLFFDPVGTHVLGGFAHLIGNVGQYVVDDARNPTKFFFAGGSAESAPSVFQSLTAPPVASPFLSFADGGIRLAVLAKGNGSDKNPVLDKLHADLDAELARVQKLQ